jgi:AcrR family transcriptional regulator
MAKRRQQHQQGDGGSREAILGAAVDRLLAEPASRVTLDSVASAAGCAKGLVHYHFKTKDNLVAAALTRIWEERRGRWEAAMSNSEPAAAIAACWQLVITEGGGGICTAAVTGWRDISESVVRTVNNARLRFVAQLGESVSALLSRMGLGCTVPAAEIASLMAAVIDGLGLQLASGAPAEALEPAWHAFWAGILSLTRPASR